MQVNRTKIKASTDRRNGFALPLVLGGLLLVSALFATAQTRGLSQISQLATEHELLNRMAEDRELLALALVALGNSEVSSDVLLADGSDRTLMLQDVGGLIDLNTAHPDLLQKICIHLTDDTSCIVKLRDWRRTGRRLLSVRDFGRIVGLPVAKVDGLAALATVYSGRFGIDPERAPDEVLLIARGQSATVPDAFRDQPTSSTFVVWAHEAETETVRYVGTIQKGVDGSESQILELN